MAMFQRFLSIVFTKQTEVIIKCANYEFLERKVTVKPNQSKNHNRDKFFYVLSGKDASNFDNYGDIAYDGLLKGISASRDIKELREACSMLMYANLIGNPMTAKESLRFCNKMIENEYQFNELTNELHIHDFTVDINWFVKNKYIITASHETEAKSIKEVLTLLYKVRHFKTVEITVQPRHK